MASHADNTQTSPEGTPPNYSLASCAGALPPEVRGWAPPPPAAVQTVALDAAPTAAAAGASDGPATPADADRAGQRKGPGQCPRRRLSLPMELVFLLQVLLVVGACAAIATVLVLTQQRLLEDAVYSGLAFRVRLARAQMQAPLDSVTRALTATSTYVNATPELRCDRNTSTIAAATPFNALGAAMMASSEGTISAVAQAYFENTTNGPRQWGGCFVMNGSFSGLVHNGSAVLDPPSNKSSNTGFPKIANRIMEGALSGGGIPTSPQWRTQYMNLSTTVLIGAFAVLVVPVGGPSQGSLFLAFVSLNWTRTVLISLLPYPQSGAALFNGAFYIQSTLPDAPDHNAVNKEFLDAATHPDATIAAVFAAKQAHNLGHRTADGECHAYEFDLRGEPHLLTAVRLEIGRLTLDVVQWSPAALFFAEGDAAKRTALFATGAAILACALFTMLLAFLVRRPVARVRARLALAVRLRCEEAAAVPCGGGCFALKQLQDLEDAFGQLNDVLRQAAPFLPQALVAELRGADTGPSTPAERGSADPAEWPADAAFSTNMRYAESMWSGSDEGPASHSPSISRRRSGETLRSSAAVGPQLLATFPSSATFRQLSPPSTPVSQGLPLSGSQQLPGVVGTPWRLRSSGRGAAFSAGAFTGDELYDNEDDAEAPAEQESNGAAAMVSLQGPGADTDSLVGLSATGGATSIHRCGSATSASHDGPALGVALEGTRARPLLSVQSGHSRRGNPSLHGVHSVPTLGGSDENGQPTTPIPFLEGPLYHSHSHSHNNGNSSKEHRRAKAPKRAEDRRKGVGSPAEGALLMSAVADHSLHQRRVAVVVVNLRDTHLLVEQGAHRRIELLRANGRAATAHFIALHTAATAAVERAAAAERGVLDTFSGDRFLLTFGAGAHGRCAHPSRAAVRAALHVVNDLLSSEVTAQSAHRRVTHAGPGALRAAPQLTIGVAAGRAVVATTLGTAATKRYGCVIGSVFTAAMGLLRAAGGHSNSENENADVHSARTGHSVAHCPLPCLLATAAAAEGAEADALIETDFDPAMGAARVWDSSGRAISIAATAAASGAAAAVLAGMTPPPAAPATPLPSASGPHLFIAHAVIAAAHASTLSRCGTGPQPPSAGPVGGDGEWLYELERIAHNNPFTRYTAAVDRARRGAYAEEVLLAEARHCAVLAAVVRGLREASLRAQNGHEAPQQSPPAGPAPPDPTARIVKAAVLAAASPADGGLAIRYATLSPHAAATCLPPAGEGPRPVGLPMVEGAVAAAWLRLLASIEVSPAAPHKKQDPQP